MIQSKTNNFRQIDELFINQLIIYLLEKLMILFKIFLKGNIFYMQEIIDNFMYYIKNNEIFARILVFAGIYFAYFLFCIILSYVFHSVGTYRLMKKRNMPNAFLAWIPFAKIYAFGSIYDDMEKKESGNQDSYFGIILLVLCLACGLFFMAPIAYIVLNLFILKKIFDKYAPNKNSYFVISVIFTILLLYAPASP